MSRRADTGNSPDLAATVPVLCDEPELLVVDKPAGIAVIPGRNEDPAACLRAVLERRFGARLWVVHRLDRDVSGVLVLARTARAHRELSLLFERSTVRKRYLALVEGGVEAESGVVDLPLRTGGHGGRTVVDLARGKPARSRYRVRERLGPVTLLEIEPETGRTHQIRVHLRALGHPLVVDRRYGRRAELAGVGRATLHSASLELVLDGVERRFEAPWPAELARLAAGLRTGEVSL